MAVDPVWTEHYRDEMDAAWLYRTLASYERDPTRRAIFERLVTVEDEHVQRWRGLFQAQGGDIPSHAPSLQTRALVWTAPRPARSSGTGVWTGWGTGPGSW